VIEDAQPGAATAPWTTRAVQGSPNGPIRFEFHRDAFALVWPALGKDPEARCHRPEHADRPVVTDRCVLRPEPCSCCAECRDECLRQLGEMYREICDGGEEKQSSLPANLPDQSAKS
jgi:hypothetical protein